MTSGPIKAAGHVGDGKESVRKALPKILQMGHHRGGQKTVGRASLTDLNSHDLEAIASCLTAGAGGFGNDRGGSQKFGFEIEGDFCHFFDNALHGVRVVPGLPTRQISEFCCDDDAPVTGYSSKNANAT